MVPQRGLVCIQPRGEHRMPSNHADAHASNSAQSRALLTLREWIVSGELAGGERIAELPLVERLGVSRTPVRAALQRLAQEGLLQPLPHGGYVVRAFTARDIQDTIALRGLLEGTAARWAAERGTSAQALAGARDLLASLDALLAEPEWGDADLLAYGRLNDRFHEALLDMADSEPLRLELARMAQLPFSAPSSFVVGQQVSGLVRQRFGIAQDQHWQVLEAIEARQGARAEALMREHAQIAQRNLQESLAQQANSSQDGRHIARFLASSNT